MLADQTMLEVSASATSKWMGEAALLTEVIRNHLQRLIRRSVTETVFDLLVSNHSGRREMCKLLTLEPFPKGGNSASDATGARLQFLRKRVESLLEADLEALTRDAGAYVDQLQSIQLRYCQDIFIPAVVDAHRFVVDRELKEIFDQLRLQRALAVHAEENGIDLQKSRRESSYDSGCAPVASYCAPTDSALTPVSTAEFLSSTPSRATFSAASPVATASNAKGRSVVSMREHQAALEQSLEREILLHGKLDAMQKALQERAAKERESVEQLTKRMEEAQAAATVEMQQQLKAFQVELDTLRADNATLESRWKMTMEVAVTLDSLVGKLNAHIACLRELMIRENIGSTLLHRLDHKLDEVRTTCCCRGRPLVVEGGWVYGDLPPTRDWLPLLQAATPQTPTVTCSEKQHDWIQGMVDFVAVEMQNKLLKEQLSAAQENAKQLRVQHLENVQKLKDEHQKRLRALEERLWHAMSENDKLRATVGRCMENAAAQPRKPLIGGPDEQRRRPATHRRTNETGNHVATEQKTEAEGSSSQKASVTAQTDHDVEQQVEHDAERERQEEILQRLNPSVRSSLCRDAPSRASHVLYCPRPTLANVSRNRRPMSARR